VLSIEGKVKVIHQIENGKKEAHVCREFGLLNWKKEEKLLVCWNRMD
jgi:hypothetical protein